MSDGALKITDTRTGRMYDVPVTSGSIHATDLRQIKESNDDFGLMSFDPAYLNTASCRSKITFIDGDAGILRYRGYPIEQLAEHSTFEECSYLIVKGELPSDKQLADWKKGVFELGTVDASLRRFIDDFDKGAHPCGMLCAALAALSTKYPEARNVVDPANRLKQGMRLIGQVPQLAAHIYRHQVGKKSVDPDGSLSYAGNFLRMMYAPETGAYKVPPALERALDVLLILHLDHEQNCSTSVMRNVASSHSDIFCSAAGAMAALYGPLHGGANEEVLKMLREIGSTGNVPAFIKKVKDREALLMGFGHRVYKNYDPRAAVIKRMADAVFAELGRNDLITVALELERIALSDEFFVGRKLYPNVDFYSGLIYEALKIPHSMFTVMFAVGRASGWAAHYLEIMQDAEQKIARPRQLYEGYGKRDYVMATQR